MSREKTNRLLELIEEGVLDRDGVILACVNYMSEDDVADMMRLNEMDEDEDEDEPTPDESDAYVNDPTSGPCGVSLDGRYIGTADDVEEAFGILARAMRDASYWPNVWHVNERGNTTLVEILDFDTGAYRFTDTAYV